MNVDKVQILCPRCGAMQRLDVAGYSGAYATAVAFCDPCDAHFVVRVVLGATVDCVPVDFQMKVKASP